MREPGLVPVMERMERAMLIRLTPNRSNRSNRP